jgi:hypothetical protein
VNSLSDFSLSGGLPKSGGDGFQRQSVSGFGLIGCEQKYLFLVLVTGFLGAG